MSVPANSLWSPDIKPDVLSPFVILEIQATALTEQTRGLLVGEVRTTDGKNDTTHLHLDIVAKELGVRRRILTARHRKDAPYPVQVDADCFRIPYEDYSDEFEQGGYGGPEEFEKIVKEVLTSTDVTSIAVNLLLRTKEALDKKQRDAATAVEPPRSKKKNGQRG